MPWSLAPEALRGEVASSSVQISAAQPQDSKRLCKAALRTAALPHTRTQAFSQQSMLSQSQLAVQTEGKANKARQPKKLLGRCWVADNFPTSLRRLSPMLHASSYARHQGL